MVGELNIIIMLHRYKNITTTILRDGQVTQLVVTDDKLQVILKMCI